MNEHPILFSTEMVRAILAGRKTQTRRIIKPQPSDNWMENTKQFSPNGSMYDHSGKQLFWLSDPTKPDGEIKCRYGKPGDRLWVRETWRKYFAVDPNGYTQFDKEIIEYASDDPPMIAEVDGDGFHVFNKDGSEKFIRWRPSIHMPKAASRIWLEGKAIRVERLQDISEEDAIAEGVWFDEGVLPNAYTLHGIGHYTTAKECYCDLWSNINGTESWELNPWVWAVTFKKIDRPIGLNQGTEDGNKKQ